MTATSRLPVGDIRSTPESWQGLRRMFDETCAVAAAAGRPVPVTVQNRMLETAQGLEPGSFSSLHDDLVHGRRMELETLHGFVVRAAAEHRLPVPMSDAVYAILKPWAMLNDRGRS
jgi:2-dehydropantoate 2-reductase